MKLQYTRRAEEQERLGPTLAKLLGHKFSAALATRDGSVFLFSAASLHGDWLELSENVYWMPLAQWDGRSFGYSRDEGDPGSRAHCLERGASVRVADIVWSADAPEGDLP
jgi:hypothetical protein